MINAGTVTLLFTDLVGSAGLIDQLGDESAELVRRTHFRLLRDAVKQHGGSEVKNLGDGLMVAFASAVDGLDCAITIQQTVSHHNASADASEQALAVRIGLHIGEPIRDEDDYFGTSVAVAKRLCDQAGAGQVLVSQLVRALVGSRGGFQFTDLGPMALKGLADPVGVHELAWEIPQPAAVIPLPPGLAGVRPIVGGRGVSDVFVGRSGDVAELMRAWEEARLGRTQMGFLAGDAGIGKTRLASEFARKVNEEGGLVLYGRSNEDILVPYQPFAEGLDHYVGTSSPMELRTQLGSTANILVRMVPRVGERLPGLLPAPDVDPEESRYRLFDAVARTLRAISEAKPLLLVLDDLHWADRASLLLLQFLAQRLPDARILVLGTYRDVEVDRNHPLTETLGQLRLEANHHKLALSGLTANDIGFLLSALSRQELDDAALSLARALHRETEGNPFFTGEILRHLLETGHIYEQDGRWMSDATSVEDLGIPEGVRAVIGRRLSRLSEECYRALGVGSVFGREFDAGVLLLATDLGEDELTVLLDDAVEHQVLTEVPGAFGRYSFAHALIRQALYESLTLTRRVRLHYRIGEALENLYAGDLEPHLPELAHHFVEAAPGGDLQKALEYTMRNGARAASQYAYEEACRHYEKALELLEDIQSPVTRCEVLIALGEARLNAGEYARAREAFRDAAQAAEPLGMSRHLARAALGYRGRLGFGTGLLDKVGIALLEKALPALGDTDSGLRARVMASLAEALIFIDTFERRKALCDEALAMARRVGDKAALAEVLLDVNYALMGPDLTLELQSGVEEAFALAQEIGDQRILLEALICRIQTLWELGDFEQAHQQFATFRQISGEMRQTYYRSLATTLAGCEALMQGRMEEGERHCWKLLEYASQGQNSNAFQLFGVQIFFIRYCNGTLETLHAGTKTSTETFSNMPVLRSGLALIYCELGMEEEARRSLETLGADDFQNVPHDAFMLNALDHLARLVEHLKDPRRAARLYEMAIPFADRHVLSGVFAAYYGPMTLTLGRLALVSGEHDLAERHLESALRTTTASGARPAHVDSSLTLASTLLARGGSGDRERALDILAAAEAEANEVGMPAFAEKVDALRQAHSGAPEISAVKPLTARQRFGRRAGRFRDEARAVLSSRAQAAMARVIRDASDDDLQRRFGSPMAQRAMFAGLTRSFQPRAAFGYEGQILLELKNPSAAGSSDWWAIAIEGDRASARRGWTPDAALVLHMTVATFVRMIAGGNSMEMWFDGLITLEGDITLAPRMEEMFGAGSSFEAAGSAGTEAAVAMEPTG
ncbi:MAG TPA: AAA family ATPase [Candidatus Dormibacteraeota bacterium]|nr:AAA family ATPase [Candidatus Dormibacteraeota bacterium]